jgi:ribosomal protein L39E
MTNDRKYAKKKQNLMNKHKDNSSITPWGAG